MRSKEIKNEVKTTFRDRHFNSCNKCWNMPKTEDNSDTAPRFHGEYVPSEIFLVDGEKYIFVGYRSECPYCGHVRAYKKGVAYRLEGNSVDFRVEYWQQLRRYRIDPAGFNKAVLTQKSRYFAVEKLPKYPSNHRAEFYEPAVVQ